MARPKSPLNKEEMAVVRSETGPGFLVANWLILFASVVGGMASMVAFHAPHGGGKGAFIIYGFPGYAPFLALYALLVYSPIAAVRKVLGFDPRKQNRAEGVIYHFYELRLTRTELIKGYGTDAMRIPLRGLTATVTNTGSSTDHSDDRRVHITIEGPHTKFVYSMAEGFLSFATRTARQFAALLNYEAGLQGAPPKAVQQKSPTTSGGPETEAHEKCTKVRCFQCQHVQAVPLGQPTYVCEQCNAHLQRSTAAANSS
jgi:hypothetical protein